MVDHEILLYKLSQFGIRGQALYWFSSYYSNRKKHTYTNKTNSTCNNIRYVVLQGSVLGPLLFLIYIYHLANCTSKDIITRLFADNSNIFIIEKSQEKLKQSMIVVLSDLSKWFNGNKLTVKINKTCNTIFKGRNKQIPTFLNSIQIWESQIKRSHQPNILA